MPFPWDRIPMLDVMGRRTSRQVVLTLDDGDVFAADDVVRFAAEIRGIRIEKSSTVESGAGVTFTPGTGVAVATLDPVDTETVVFDSVFDVEWDITTAGGLRYTLGRARLPVRVDKFLVPAS